MILHVNADRDGASLVSIPRDSWVDVPGYGYNKINAAFSLAGPSLAIETVENLTGVRIDHLAVVDWAGFQSLIDTVGGVTVTVPRTIEDPHNHVVWTKGRQTLNGDQALLYVPPALRAPHGRRRPGEAAAGHRPRPDAVLAVDPAVRTRRARSTTCWTPSPRTSPSTPAGSSGTCATWSWTCAA